MKKVFMKIQVAVVALFLTTNLSFAEYNVQFYQTYGNPNVQDFKMLKQLPNNDYIACGTVLILIWQVTMVMLLG